MYICVDYICIKLKFHGNSFLVASSRPQHVTRKSGVSDEDATRMLATCPQQVKRVGFV